MTFKGKSMLFAGGAGSFGTKVVAIVLSRYEPEKLIVAEVEARV